MITSVNNGQVKNIIQLNQKTKARREQGLFVAEGRKMFGEAPRDWISKVYVSEALSGDAELMVQVEKLPYEIVTDSVFRQMSDTQTPQGIMTVLKKPSYIMEDILGGKNPLVMILEDLQDPGNAGTILRTGEGAGAPSRSAACATTPAMTTQQPRRSLQTTTAWWTASPTPSRSAISPKLASALPSATATAPKAAP